MQFKGKTMTEFTNKPLLMTNLGTGVVFSSEFNRPTDIICNNFSMKDTIIEVLSNSKNLEPCNIPDLAEEIKEAFAVKLRFKQG
jgi:hypothetical protein